MIRGSSSPPKKALYTLCPCSQFFYTPQLWLYIQKTKRTKRKFWGELFHSENLFFLFTSLFTNDTSEYKKNISLSQFHKIIVIRKRLFFHIFSWLTFSFSSSKNHSKHLRNNFQSGRRCHGKMNFQIYFVVIQNNSNLRDFQIYFTHKALTTRIRTRRIFPTINFHFFHNSLFLFS